jgi:hypothetical protein
MTSHSATGEPWRVALARRFTGDDFPKFIDQVRKDKPNRRTPNEYERVFESPFASDSPRVQTRWLELEIMELG